MPIAAVGGADHAKCREKKPHNHAQWRLVFEAFHVISQARAAGRVGIRSSLLRITQPLRASPCLRVSAVKPFAPSSPLLRGDRYCTGRAVVSAPPSRASTHWPSTFTTM
jgi:hypothetical protein